MKVVVGIDLGSTTTKAVLLDEDGRIVGRGITNSRSNYDVAAAVARQEALTATRFALLERTLEGRDGLRAFATLLHEAFRLEVYLDQLGELRREIAGLVGVDALEDADRLVLEGARIGREFLIGQNAFHPHDAFSTVAKTYHLARLLWHFMRTGGDALKEGMAFDKLDLASVRGAFGSVKTAVGRISPDAIFGSHFSFCASLPPSRISSAAISERVPSEPTPM